MAIEIIDVGSAPNDGQGDPIRTAYVKCNNNFGELSSRQQNPPTDLTGKVGDVAGMYAFDENYWYYCFQNYNANAANTVIWQQVSSESPERLVFGNSNVIVSNTAINMSVDGTANVLQVLSNGVVLANSTVTGSAAFLGNIQSQSILPSGNLQFDLGAADAQWRSLYLGGNTIYLGTAQITSNATAVTLTSGSGASFSVSGTSSSGNLLADNISANIVAANVFVGDGSGLTNITAFANIGVTQIANGLTNFAITSISGNIEAQVNGVSNIFLITSQGLSTSGNFSIDNNFSVAGNANLSDLSASNISVSGTGIITGNLSSANFNTGLISASGNVTAANINTGGEILATGNIRGQRLHSNVLLETQDAICAGNITVSGFAAIGGNISSPSVSVTNTTDATSTTSGALQVVGGIGVGGTVYTNDLVVVGNTNISNLSASSLTGVIDSARLSGSYTGITAVGTLSSLSVSGNATANNIASNSITSNNSVVSVTMSASGNATANNITSNNSIVSVTVTASGNVTGGNIITGGNVIATGSMSLSSITKTGSNGVGNIGSASSVFNTVFAKATSAQYADLAEKYTADAEYQPGTVVCFGGSAEVTASNNVADHRVAGVISENPSYIMNSGLLSPYTALVALQGRVFCKVQGPVNKGDLLVSGPDGHAVKNNEARAGTILGKSLENFQGDKGTIEISVGRS